jgi:NAD(P)-dependent dehydrogenase (short-subunit alcohol dehydrogenase family)
MIASVLSRTDYTLTKAHNMSNAIEGTRILIFGGSSGIGLGVAKAVLAAGCQGKWTDASVFEPVVVNVLAVRSRHILEE